MRWSGLPILLVTYTLSVNGQAVLNVLPRLVHVELGNGVFPLHGDVTIALADRSLVDEGDFLAQALRDVGAVPLLVRDNPKLKGVIRLDIANDLEMPAEGYILRIWPEEIQLLGADAAGVFHGLQTLIQLIDNGSGASIPCAVLSDYPRFTWRGMHLDVCRHFFPVDFVKEYIDLMARYKMNTFHWHLTDDQGWRIEIKKHPKLTSIGAWRSGSQVGPYAAQTFDSTRYGGFYTQEQIREVVAYAASRHITVVPEIEMPGHALAALAAYPFLGCTGGPYEVQKGWGVFDDVLCAGNDSVFDLLGDVLAEVMQLFPGEYIHVGGDECPKTRWKTCPKCQARMKGEGLKDEHELQSYFIRRIEKFVNSKGRKIIGWDEILEGGLAPNAAVMSWRGIEGGIAAARQKHNVVMSPGSHCYFDHYQGDPAQEPLAIGGYTTVQKVYSYEPVPDTLTEEEAPYILGAQGNLWAEYITTTEHLEYMAMPRMIALSEVLWTPKEDRDEADFIRRLELEFENLDRKGVNYSKSLYQVTITPRQGKAPGEIQVELACGLDGDLAYTTNLDDTIRIYQGPVSITHDLALTAARPKDGRVFVTRSVRNFQFNLSTARPITCDPLPSDRYKDGGPFTLVDGITAGPRRVNYEWLGWSGKEVTITVDLGEVKDFTHIGIGTLDETSSWIHLPVMVGIGAGDDPGTIELSNAEPTRVAGTNRVSFITERPFHGRYVRIRADALKHIPDGMPGAGEAAWMFLDEITVK